MKELKKLKQFRFFFFLNLFVLNIKLIGNLFSIIQFIDFLFLIHSFALNFLHLPITQYVNKNIQRYTLSSYIRPMIDSTDPNFHNAMLVIDPTPVLGNLNSAVVNNNNTKRLHCDCLSATGIRSSRQQLSWKRCSPVTYIDYFRLMSWTPRPARPLVCFVSARTKSQQQTRRHSCCPEQFRQ